MEKQCQKTENGCCKKNIADSGIYFGFMYLELEVDLL